MKQIRLVLLGFGLIFQHSIGAQWKPDSVLNFVAFGDNSVIGSIEYFKYNEKDSLVESSLIEIQDGKKVPLHKHTYSYAKAKAGYAQIISIHNYVEEKKDFVLSFVTTKVISKSGRVLSEMNQNVASDGSKVNENKTVYSYNNMGKLILSEFYRWNKSKADWEIESSVKFTYGFLFEEVLFSQRDSATNLMAPLSKTEIYYNADLTYDETVKYNYDKHVWMPDERMIYGYDTVLNVEGQIVQKFSTDKCGWENKFYYVKKRNTKDLVDTEIHMHWENKDWLVDLTYFFEYNEQDILIKLLNEKKEILISRYGQIR